MTHGEHATEAERLLTEAADASKGFGRKGFAAPDLQGKLLAASVHAQLALYKQSAG